MGLAASSWSFTSMGLRGKTITSNVLSPDISASRRSSSADDPRSEATRRITLSWDFFLEDLLKFLDTNSLRSVTSISRAWSTKFNGQGSRISVDATCKLFGQGREKRMFRYLSKARNCSDTALSMSKTVSPLPVWINVCDFLFGHLYCKVPGASQTSTSVALALVSNFLMAVREGNFPQFVCEKEVDQLCANSFLLAFTASAIAVKIEEGLYYKDDSIPYPTGHIPLGSYPPLSKLSVLAAEEIILRVLKMTVPVYHFAQFARPLWYRMMVLDDERWRQQLSRRSDIPRPPSLSTQSKQTVFRFIHHSSSRHGDCSEEGSSIHPSVKAICVSIFSIALSHVLNLKYKEQFIRSHPNIPDVEVIEQGGIVQEASGQSAVRARPTPTQLHNLLRSPTSSSHPSSAVFPPSSHPFTSYPPIPSSLSVHAAGKEVGTAAIKEVKSAKGVSVIGKCLSRGISAITSTTSSFHGTTPTTPGPSFTASYTPSFDPSFCPLRSSSLQSHPPLPTAITPLLHTAYQITESSVQGLESTVQDPFLRVSLDQVLVPRVKRKANGTGQEVKKKAAETKAVRGVDGMAAKKAKGDGPSTHPLLPPVTPHSLSLPAIPTAPPPHASPQCTFEGLGRELITALLYEDLKDRKQGRGDKRWRNHHSPRYALQAISMTLDALLANHEEIKRLHEHIIRSTVTETVTNQRPVRTSSSSSSASSRPYPPSVPSISSKSTSIAELEKHALKYLPVVKRPNAREPLRCSGDLGGERPYEGRGGIATRGSAALNKGSGEIPPRPLTASSTLGHSPGSKGRNSANPGGVGGTDVADRAGHSASRGGENGGGGKGGGGGGEGDIAEGDKLAVETYRLLFRTTGGTATSMQEGRDLVTAICGVSQREMSVMQTQVSLAVNSAFSRYKPQYVAPTLCSLQMAGVGAGTGAAVRVTPSHSYSGRGDGDSRSRGSGDDSGGKVREGVRNVTGSGYKNYQRGNGRVAAGVREAVIGRKLDM